MWLTHFFPSGLSPVIAVMCWVVLTLSAARSVLFFTFQLISSEVPVLMCLNSLVNIVSPYAFHPAFCMVHCYICSFSYTDINPSMSE